MWIANVPRKTFPVKIKGRIYETCVSSVMVYGNETRRFKEIEMAVLMSAERAIMRPVCILKAVDLLAKANGGRWQEHILGLLCGVN